MRTPSPDRLTPFRSVGQYSIKIKIKNSRTELFNIQCNLRSSISKIIWFTTVARSVTMVYNIFHDIIFGIFTQNVNLTVSYFLHLCYQGGLYKIVL